MNSEPPIGAKVQLRGQRSNLGVITRVEGDYASVFWAGGREEMVAMIDLEAPGAASSGVSTPRELLLALTASRLEHPLTNQLLSYRASRTKMFPHQFIPVRKLVNAPGQRLLIADEVGTGKTIEAGLIWAELEARAAGGLSNVLVVCPKALVEKWRQEFLHRFDLSLEHLDSAMLRTALASAERDGALSPQFSYSIVGLELLRTRLPALLQADPHWDLVVIDEAHHLRNTNTKAHAIGRALGERTNAMVLLTATPMQTSTDNLRALFQILEVSVADDLNTFQSELEHDMRLNDLLALVRKRPPDWRVEVDRQLADLEGVRPGLGSSLRQIKDLIRAVDAGDARTLAAAHADLRQRVQDLQTFAPFMTRTMRVDVDEKRPLREPVVRKVEFTAAQRAFYDAVLEQAMERAQEQGIPPGFVTQMPERRTASSPVAVATEVMERHSSGSAAARDTTSWTSSDIAELAPLARAVLSEEDPKIAALLTATSRLFDEGHESLIVFSTFKRTLAYITAALRNAGFTAEQVDGDTPQRDEDCRKGQKSREALAADFRAGEFQILVASEVASEGLDFQTCSALVNYDLPWNPMRVEQRIGRIDRIGQKSEKVTVVSFSTPGTIEHRILERLYTRLEVFERALGEMELILGEALEQFHKDLFCKKLTPAQQEEHLDRIAVGLVNQQRRLAEVEQEHGALFGAVQRVEVDKADFKRMERDFLRADHLRQFVIDTLNAAHGTTAGKEALEEQVVFDLEILRPDLEDLTRSLPAASSARRSVRRLVDRARNGDTQLVGTFHDSGYREHVDFVHIRHPLVLLARHLRQQSEHVGPIAFGQLRAPEGFDYRGPLIFGWAIASHQAVLSLIELKEIAIAPDGSEVELGSNFRPIDLLRQAVELHGRAAGVGEWSEVIEGLPSRLADAGREATEQLKTRNEALVERARHSLENSSRSRRLWLEEQLRADDLDPKRRRMFESWLSRLDRELAEGLKKLASRATLKFKSQFIGAAVIQVVDGA
jgi:superfamily II DNA or RNA helicase